MTRTLLVISLLLAATAACNESTEGAEGKILFTPQNCGWLAGCDFDQGIAVGGEVEVHISPATGDVSTAGLDLATSDPNVFTVINVPDVGGAPTWLITGIGPGAADLIAFDPLTDVNIDFFSIGIQELNGLRFDDFIGASAGPDTSDSTYDEIWTVDANENVSFQVIPTIGTEDIMGDMGYTVTLETVGFEDYLLADAEVGDGYLSFNAPAGDYEVSVVADNGTEIFVQFHVVE